MTNHWLTLPCFYHFTMFLYIQAWVRVMFDWRVIKWWNRMYGAARKTAAASALQAHRRGRMVKRAVAARRVSPAGRFNSAFARGGAALLRDEIERQAHVFDVAAAAVAWAQLSIAAKAGGDYVSPLFALFVYPLITRNVYLSDEANRAALDAFATTAASSGVADRLTSDTARGRRAPPPHAVVLRLLACVDAASAARARGVSRSWCVAAERDALWGGDTPHEYGVARLALGEYCVC